MNSTVLAEYVVGENVYYKTSEGAEEPAIIIARHQDDYPHIYYTIQVKSTQKEKQTNPDRLYRYSFKASTSTTLNVDTLIFIAQSDYISDTLDELSFQRGDKIRIINMETEWWYGESVKTGQLGCFPPSFGIVVDSTDLKNLPSDEILLMEMLRNEANALSENYVDNNIILDFHPPIDDDKSSPENYMQIVDNTENHENTTQNTVHVDMMKTSSLTTTTIDCECCYNDYMINEMIQCSEGHIFCKQCLQHYVEETIFGNGRSVITCMNSSSNNDSICYGYFPESMIQACLSEQVYMRYNEAVARDILKTIQLPLVTCHNCQLQTELDESVGNTLICPQCTYKTCRLCKEEGHEPILCNEVEKKAETNIRLTVEEAMTQARVRTCPKCHTRFFKTEGCNRMTCTCGTSICYICKKDITAEGYSHFGTGKCTLHTNTLEDDRRAMYDAGLKVLEEAKSTPAISTTTDSNIVPINNVTDTYTNTSDVNINRIELSKLLEGGQLS